MISSPILALNHCLCSSMKEMKAIGSVADLGRYLRDAVELDVRLRIQNVETSGAQQGGRPPSIEADCWNQDVRSYGKCPLGSM